MVAKSNVIEPVFPVLTPKISKAACALVKQENVSNKVLLGITQGIGNVIMATPLMKALRALNLEIDILEGGFKTNAVDVLKNMDGVSIITEEEAGKKNYLLGIQTVWPREGIERFCTQVRSAGNIIQAWQNNIFAHEVEMNMSVAYTLNYQGEVPSLYCDQQPSPRFYTFVREKDDRIFVGIHICRTYHHQFYANRALQNPIKIARVLIEAGYQPVLVGHKGAVVDTLAWPIGTVDMCGTDLSTTADTISKLDCMINEDSGIMHVTAAMDTPQIAVFGPTSDLKNRPWSAKAAVIRQGLACVPCQYTPKETTCTNNVCMSVSPEYIVKQVEMLIEKFPKNAV